MTENDSLERIDALIRQAGEIVEQTDDGDNVPVWALRLINCFQVLATQVRGAYAEHDGDNGIEEVMESGIYTLNYFKGLD